MARPSKKKVSKRKTQANATEKQIVALVKNVKKRSANHEEAFIQLRAQLQYYIKNFSKKYKIPGCDADEIEQECLFALRYKAINDFNAKRGKFKSFAILCIRRHLFSLIKGNNQQKRKALNTSISLDEDRSEDGENLTLVSLITNNELSADDQLAKSELFNKLQSELLAELSALEADVFFLYTQKYRYDEIVERLQKKYPNKEISRKSVDNSLQRIRNKSVQIINYEDFYDY